MAYRLERFGDKDCQRIVNEDGAVVAFAMAYANGAWGLHDADDRPLKRGFARPKDVLAAFVEMKRGEPAPSI